MVTELLTLQPLASVTVNVYVPAARMNVPVPVYGAVPPVAVTITVALSAPQGIGDATAEITSCGGSLMFTVTVSEQLFASVTVNVCVPPGTEKLPVPVYGGVPPVAFTVTVAFSPLQRMLVAVALASS
jgi:hypothetical protein